MDLGPLGVKRSSAQVTDRYRLADLVGRQVVCVVNFPPKQVAGPLAPLSTGCPPADDVRTQVSARLTTLQVSAS